MTTDDTPEQQQPQEAAAPPAGPRPEGSVPRFSDRPSGDRPGGGDRFGGGDRPGGGDRFGGGDRGGDRGGYRRGPGGRPGGPRRPRRKVCSFCVEKGPVITYKDVARLRRFVSERGKILPRRTTGTCGMHQRTLARAIKRAREIALLPFVAE